MSKVQIAFLGDIMLGRGEQLMGGFSPESWQIHAIEILKAGNIDCFSLLTLSKTTE